MNIDNDDINKTRVFWGDLIGSDVNTSEAGEIIKNVSDFFGILQEWTKSEKTPNNNPEN